MSAKTKKPDSAEILRGLKDFQRRTVDYVFRRLYLDRDQTRRFLIADEVGLGKTLVARGVIAKAIDHLWDQVDRVDIIYICSNADIARQNIARLNIAGAHDFSLPSRITLLPKYVRGLTSNRLNFVAFTPGTSFHLKSSTGIVEERALLYRLLKQPWTLRGKAPRHVLRAHASIETFDRACKWALSEETEVDGQLEQDFLRELKLRIRDEQQRGSEDLRARFERLCQVYNRSDARVSREDAYDRIAWIGEMRGLLATVCLEALTPDVIILDEFQRFKQLLKAEDDAGILARNLFRYTNEKEGSQARVLLLSATPYKMYSMTHESDVDNHYTDFLNTLQFLTDNQETTDAFQRLLQDYSRAFFQHAGADVMNLVRIKEQIEARLRKVMVRTEKLASTETRDGMLQHVAADRLMLTSGDLCAFVRQQALAEALDHHSIIEYWKSAPYLLNFMDDYALKRRFEQKVARKGGQNKIQSLVRESKQALLRWNDVVRYRPVDPGNTKLRHLLADTVDRGVWKLLWIPPSLPYYDLGGVFAEEGCRNVTKRLVFSSWKIVPKVIAGLTSYEAERRAILAMDPSATNTIEERKKRRALLRFALSDGRLTGMPVLGMIYPSPRLAALCDPLALRKECGGGTAPTLEDVFRAARRRIEQALSVLDVVEDSSGPTDERWYWAAPILLDKAAHPKEAAEWFSQEALYHLWRSYAGRDAEDDSESRWNDHIEEMKRFALEPAGMQKLGKKPEDLAAVLASVGVGGLGCCALRAFARLGSASTMLSPDVRNCAGAVAQAFLSLFNVPESMGIVRGADAREPYWLRVAEYCCNGCLQSVLDEYVHVLKESMGLFDTPIEESARVLGKVISEALFMRTSRVAYDSIRVSNKGNGVLVKQKSMRIRFALRFGAERDDETGEVTREDHVRAAFNSPFWPFVLATTSIGQEGLDFHQYCHAVVHWNIPSNPVDLEQREGRVHRYKGHAVRKNLARAFGHGVWSGNGSDPWDVMFRAAVADRRQGASDVHPFWVFPVENGASIERHVFNLPLSREEYRLHDLRRALAAYRLVFGQPRQEDMLAYLLNCVPESDLQRMAEALRINLEPGQE